MTVYFLAAVNINDREAYKHYETAAYPSHLKYGAECGLENLAICDAPESIEGPLPARRIVLLKFNDREAFNKWYGSPEYRNAIPLRSEAADTAFAVMFEGGRPEMPHIYEGLNPADMPDHS